MSTMRYTVNPGWRVLMNDLGVRPLSVLKRARLPQDLFAKGKTSISSKEYFCLWEALVEEANDSLLPLKVGEAISTEAFDPSIFAALNSPNLNVALSRLAKYKPLIGPMALHITEHSKFTQMEIEWLDKIVVPPPPLVAMELVFFVQLARMGTRSHIHPLKITSLVPLAPATKYRDWFGTRVQTGDSACIQFRAEDATMPFVTANETMWSFFEPELQKNLDILTKKTSMTQRVKASLLELIPSGLAAMDEVAQKLGTSTRTLQRSLKQEDTRFQTVLADTRQELAMHYLKSSTMSGAEISFLLGFDDPNSFFRAFRNWTGETPEQIRAAITQAN